LAFESTERLFTRLLDGQNEVDAVARVSQSHTRDLRAETTEKRLPLGASLTMQIPKHAWRGFGRLLQFQRIAVRKIVVARAPLTRSKRAAGIDQELSHH
jgi:hypothetical protein